VLYCGTILTEDGKDRKIAVVFEPFKPINTSLYLCDNRFHTEALQELLVSDERYGFIVVDGSGALYGVLQGNTRTVLHKFVVDLPKKHGRGGQSAQRFGRIRMEKRQAYVRKVAEVAVQMFIQNDVPNVQGIILAGSAEFKVQLSQSDFFDPRLLDVVLATVDVSYGGDNGFNQAIELAAETLRNTKFVREKKLLTTYMSEISRDTGRICFGLKDTLTALEMGGVETLILWEELPLQRFEMSDPSTGAVVVRYLTEQQEKDMSHFRNAATGADMEVIDKQPMVDWMAVNYKNYGCALEFITDCSTEGAQYVQGFGGIGGLLRYPIDFAALEGDAGAAAGGAAIDDDEDFL